MKLSRARVGELLKVKQRPIVYSRHPVVRRSRRFGLQTRVFATNPWSVIRGAINGLADTKVKTQALSFVEQAGDFYRAYQSAHEVASKPLLVYYAIMNLVKAFVLFKKVRPEYAKAQHGIGESVPPGRTEFDDTVLNVFLSVPGAAVNVFDDFMMAFTGNHLPVPQYQLKYIHPQILQGHRLWATANEKTERFVEIESIDFVHDPSSKSIWIVLKIFSDDLSRFNISAKRLLKDSGLSSKFRHVDSEDRLDDRLLLKFEQISPLSYTGRPSDRLEDLVNLFKDDIWSAVLRMPPYRKNYLYLSTAVEMSNRLPQILSAYALIYYLGSVTRYRPYYFETIISKKNGAHIEELISNIPQQFLFLLASEFAGREVAHAPLV